MGGLVPEGKEGWAAALIAATLQAGLVLSIAVPSEIQGWAAFGTALLVAAISPDRVIKRARNKLGPKNAEKQAR